MDETEARARIAFLEAAEALKDVHRSGFTGRGRPEDTAAHSWRLCLWLVVFADAMPGIDLAHALRMAVIHDLGEAISGDIPATRQTGSKTAEERADFKTLIAGLPTARQHEMLALWDEYEAGETDEAILVKGFDKLETILQHTQGARPEAIDFPFNLTYARARTDAHPLLRELRAMLDEKTREHVQDIAKN